MQYYYLGLTVDSPEREQALTYRNTFLEELNISTRGRMFVEPYANLLHNQKFMKLVSFMQPYDVLIMHDMTRSGESIYNMLEVLGILHDKSINIINMAFPRVNTFDYPFMYEELSELLLLLQNYTVFLYCIATRTLDTFDFLKIMPLFDMDSEFDSFIKHTVRSEIRGFGMTSTVDEFMAFISTEESLQYVQQTLGISEMIRFDDSFSSLYYFNEYAHSAIGTI